MKMKSTAGYGILFLCIMLLFTVFMFPVGVNAYADNIFLSASDVYPLTEIQINITNAQTNCTINVTRPDNRVDSFPGTIVGTNCTGNYVPTFLIGTYYVNGTTGGHNSPTDTFTVSSPSGTINFVNFTSDTTEYILDVPIEFNLSVNVSDGRDMSGLKYENTNPNAQSTDDAMYLEIRRELVSVNATDYITARLYIEYDSYPSDYAQFGAGTMVNITLYGSDGQSPLPSPIEVTNFSLSPENTTNSLTKPGAFYKWMSRVDEPFNGSTKTHYLEFIIPPQYSLSDIIFSVDFINLSYDYWFTDSIYIGETVVSDSDLNGGDDGEVTYNTSDEFSNLGRLPIYLPMTPDNGTVFIKINNSNYVEPITGNVTDFSDGNYSVDYTWTRYTDENYTAYACVNKWGYNSDNIACSSGINLTSGGSSLTNMVIFDQEADSESQSESNDARVYVNEETTFYVNYTLSAGNAPVTGTILDLNMNYFGSAVAFFDNDGDGIRDDVVFGRYSAGGDELYAYDQNGNLLWDVDVGTIYEIEVADVNDDTYDEIIVARGGNLRVYSRSGSLLCSAGSGTFISVATGDIDGDGVTDFVGGDTNEDVEAYDGTCNQIWVNSNIGYDAWEIYTHDFDNDGRDDVIVAAYSYDVRFLNGTDGTIDWTSGNVGNAWSMELVDLDRDGIRDEIVISASDGEIWAYDDDFTELFNNFNIGGGFYSGINYGSASEITAADMDNDS